MSDEQTTTASPEQVGSSAAPAGESKPLTAEERKAAALTKAAAKKAELAAKEAAPAKPAPAARPAPAQRPAARPKPDAFERPKDVTRREFLNLAWLGSMTLLTVQTLGVSVLFLYPTFKEGQFGGIFDLAAKGAASEILPELNGPPVPFTDGKFWLTNTDKGVYALYKVCTHLGCLYAWADVTSRFECPCHGSKFELTGKYIAGPAPRSLDRFRIIATRPDGTTIETPPDGAGIQLNGDETLAIDTGARIQVDGRVEV